MNSHAVNDFLSETLGDVDGMLADAEVEARAEVQAIRGVEVRRGPRCSNLWGNIVHQNHVHSL